MPSLLFFLGLFCFFFSSDLGWWLCQGCAQALSFFKASLYFCAFMLWPWNKLFFLLWNLSIGSLGVPPSPPNPLNVQNLFRILWRLWLYLLPCSLTSIESSTSPGLLMTALSFLSYSVWACTTTYPSSHLFKVALPQLFCNKYVAVYLRFGVKREIILQPKLAHNLDWLLEITELKSNHFVNKVLLEHSHTH